jgi:hypothetical protein
MHKTPYKNLPQDVFHEVHILHEKHQYPLAQDIAVSKTEAP